MLHRPGYCKLRGHRGGERRERGETFFARLVGEAAGRAEEEGGVITPLKRRTTVRRRAAERDQPEKGS